MARPRPGPICLLQRRAALGERERLFVPVLDQRDVRLVVADDAEHVLRLGGRGEPLGLPQRRARLVEPARFGEHDAGKRVHEGQIPPIAGRVQRRGRLGHVLPDDGRVADLLVAEAELVMGETNRLGIVGQLRLPQRASEQRDRARLVAARERDPAMKAPEHGKHGRRQGVPRGIGRPSEQCARLHDVIGEQPGFGERAAEDDFVFALQSRGLQRIRQHANRLRMLSTLERNSGAGQRRLKGDGHHGRSIRHRRHLFEHASEQPRIYLERGSRRSDTTVKWRC